jgi:uncharacterized protein (TIGR00369 family)
MTPAMTGAELGAFMWRAFPQAAEDFRVEHLTSDGIVMRLKVADKHLRPGGTISGPSIFGLADVAVYLAILARIGPVALAVTTNGAVDFLRKPVAGVDLLGEARILKLGKSLAVGDVLIRSEGTEAPVARATMTYSIPPRREVI